MERYDITKSFEENKKEGPYGYEDIKDRNEEIKSILGEYGIEADFFGYKTKLPLGVAAGPLFSSRFMKAAAMDGFNVITWKTFRTINRLAHRNNGDYLGHNIVMLHKEGQLKTDDFGKPLQADLVMPENKQRISITNSFGMGSDAPDVWMPQVTELEKWMEQHNKQTVASCVGSPQEGWGVEELGADYAKCAKYAQDAGSRIIQLNFSCPNVKGKEGAIFKNPTDAASICKQVRENLNPDTKVLVKLGYCQKSEYRELLHAINPFVDGVIAINTIPMSIVDKDGKQALPGGLRSGTCGYGILDLAVESVKLLSDVRREMGLDLMIVGCGGVTNAEAAMKHIEAGADFVFVATAALFQTQLPVEFAKYIRDNQIKRVIGKKWS